MRFAFAAYEVSSWNALLGACNLKGNVNPLNPHDASKNHFVSLKNDLIYYTYGFWNENVHGTILTIAIYFVHLVTHFKSSSSTTSRELRQQFATYSGRR